MEENEQRLMNEPTLAGALLIFAGMAVGFCGILLDILWGSPSLLLISSGIVLSIVGFIVPFF